MGCSLMLYIINMTYEKLMNKATNFRINLNNEEIIHIRAENKVIERKYKIQRSGKSDVNSPKKIIK